MTPFIIAIAGIGSNIIFTPNHFSSHFTNYLNCVKFNQVQFSHIYYVIDDDDPKLLHASKDNTVTIII